MATLARALRLARAVAFTNSVVAVRTIVKSKIVCLVSVTASAMDHPRYHCPQHIPQAKGFLHQA
jgi:hypothetical protein